MTFFKLDDHLARALVNYLAGRPYLEVHQFIQALQRMERIDGRESVASAGKIDDGAWAAPPQLAADAPGQDARATRSTAFQIVAPGPDTRAAVGTVRGEQG